MSSALPSRPAQIAIILGFVEGTWALVDGFHRIITGDFIRLLGHVGPWAGWGGAAIVLGALWMGFGNLYLFQNRWSNWAAMLGVALVSFWRAGGWVTAVLALQLVLLLLPETRAGLRTHH